MGRTILTHWQHAPAGSRGRCDTDCHYPGVPLTVDMAGRMQQYSLRYRGPAELWQEGLPLGNGDLAAMCYQPAASLCWGMTKSDVRDLRHPVVPWTSHQEFERIFQTEKNHLLADQINEQEWDFRTYFPCFLPAGGLFLSSEVPDVLTVRGQTLDLYSATHTMDLVGDAQVCSFVYADANVLAIRLSGLRDKTLNLRLSPEALPPNVDRENDTPTAQTIRREVFRALLPQWRADQATLQIDYADGHRTLWMLQIRGAQLQAPGDNSQAAKLRIESDSAELMLTLVSSRQGGFLHRRAALLLETAWQRNFDRLHADHRNFWHERFARSVVQIPEPILEALWCYAIYTMAASSRGSFPAPLMSAWNLRLDQPYGGDYHNNINSQMCYWPLAAANHPDLIAPYIKHFWSVLPEIESETRRVWNLPGVKVPFASIGRGIDHWGVGYWRYELFVSAWVAQLAWWHYQFTSDLELLREQGWPLIRGVAEFYLAYLQPHPQTGRLSIPLSKLCEDTMFNVVPSQRLVRDAGTDLCAIHAHLRDAADAADALDLSHDAIRYRTALRKLTPLPRQNGQFSLAPDVPLDVPVSHPYQIMPIYPSGLVTALGPDDLLPVAQRTLANVWRCSSRVTVGQPDSGRLRWNDDLSMGWLAAARAWMGDGDGALDDLLNGWVTSTLKCNGFLAEQSRAPEGRGPMHWMQNQLCGLANGINEMLLQSHSGVIQIFPAMPARWPDAAFIHLLARPGVLVSAQRQAGQTRWVTLHAKNNLTVLLRNPWPGTDEQIVLAEPHEPLAPLPLVPDENGNFTLTLQADRPVILALRSQMPDMELAQPLSWPATPQTPWSFTGPVPLRPTDPPPDATWTSWWGKA